MAVWLITSGSKIPEGAIRAGYEADGRPLFIARASMEGVLTPGKCGYHLSGAQIPYGGKEHIVDHYEVLVQPTNTKGFLDWQPESNGNLPKKAYKTDKNIFVGRMSYLGIRIPCKISTTNRCAYFSYDGKEYSTEDYEALYQLK